MQALSQSIYSLYGSDFEDPGIIGIAPTRRASAKRVRKRADVKGEPLFGSGGGTKVKVERDSSAVRLEKEPHKAHSDLKKKLFEIYQKIKNQIFIILA